jgi:signal transduction histidine kinase
MKLVAKLTAALVLAMCVVLAIFGYRSVERERRLLDAQRHRSEQLILHALSTAVAKVWRHDGRAEAMRLVADADARNDGLRIRWVFLDAPAGDPFAPEVRPTSSLPAGDILRVEPPDGKRTFVYASVDVGEARRGAIELTESLEEEDRFLRESAAAAAITAVSLVVICGVLALGLGAFFVGRPVQQIVDKTRRIGEGNLDDPLVIHQRDELDRVADEINRMCERLAMTRESLAKETTARIAAIEQLRHADRLSTVGKLASGIAHELGTPLNVVSGRAKRIVRRDPPPDTAEDARIVVEQTERMTKIIRQLLDFARRRAAQKAPGDVATIARGVLDLLAPIAQKRKVTLQLAAGEEPARAEVDAGQMQQVLTNLVMNGIQAMPKGGELRVAVSREHATPPPGHGGAAGEHLAIRIVDQGEGIRPEDLPHIFEPFFTTKDVGEGTGLGLSVTWGLVEEHDGWIDVTSELGHGTTFTVYLPCSQGS